MKKGVLGLLVSLFMLFSACTNLSDPDETLILNVDNEFEISIKEILGNDERSIAFQITSLEKQDCEKTELDIKKKESSDQLNIEITDIIFPPNCGELGSYPIGVATFAVLERIYKLEVNVNDVINHNGILEVADNTYKLALENAKGLILTKDILNRVPDNFVWGYYTTEKMDEINKINDFLETHNLEINALSNLSQGYYSYFNIDDNGLIEVELETTTGSTISFGFENLSIKSLEAEINDFKSINPEIDIFMFGSDGSAF
jgi:hypothetical protein